MPFCGACGRENEPAQNFCDECGAPLKKTEPLRPAEQPPPPPVPPLTSPLPPQPFPPESVPPPPPAAGPLQPVQPPLPAEEVPRKHPPYIRLIGIAVAALVIIAAGYFIVLPRFTGISGSGTGAQATPAATPVPTFTQVTTTVPRTTVITILPTPRQTIEERYEETYEQVYATNRAFRFGQKETFPYQLNRPPLYIKFNVTPAMINRTYLVDIGTSAEHYEYGIYPDPNAWLEVRALDAAGGAVIDKRGFGVSKGYSITTQQEFMVRSSGNYVVELAGHDVTAAVRVLIGT